MIYLVEPNIDELYEIEIVGKTFCNFLKNFMQDVSFTFCNNKYTIYSKGDHTTIPNKIKLNINNIEYSFLLILL